MTRTVSYIQNNFLDTDVVTLQETEVTINPTLAAAFGSNYYVFHAFHDDNYWESWITVNPPFARNGVSIAVSKAKYDTCSFMDKPLGTGNHVVVAKCRHIALNKWFRFVSLHFDSDLSNRRGTESTNLVAFLDADTSRAYIDVLAGDFNANVDTTPLNHRILGQGFVDATKAVGISETTSPYSSTYNGNTNWGNIDHVCVRGSGVAIVSAKVHSNNLWNIFPVLQGQKGIENENRRITRNMEILGSDHFPVEATFSVPL